MYLFPPIPSSASSLPHDTTTTAITTTTTTNRVQMLTARKGLAGNAVFKKLRGALELLRMAW
jgi:hypothetical protein